MSLNVKFVTKLNWWLLDLRLGNFHSDYNRFSLHSVKINEDILAWIWPPYATVSLFVAVAEVSLTIYGLFCAIIDNKFIFTHQIDRIIAIFLTYVHTGTLSVVYSLLKHSHVNHNFTTIYVLYKSFTYLLKPNRIVVFGF